MASVDELALRVQLPAFAGTTLPAEYAGLLAEGLGGVCYFGSNTADGPAAVAALSAAIRAANPRAVIAVDEEGGDVTRLHAMTGSPVLGPAALGAADDLWLTRETGRAIGAELAAVGVNLDLGPVADVNSNPDNPVIGTRSFGDDPERVAAARRDLGPRPPGGRGRRLRQALPGPRRHRAGQPPRAAHRRRRPLHAHRPRAAALRGRRSAPASHR